MWLFLLGAGFRPARAQTVPGTTFRIRYDWADKDTSINPASLKLKESVNSLTAAEQYVREIPGLLRASGFPASSVDSIQWESSQVRVLVFLGPRYAFSEILLRADQTLLNNCAGLERTTYRSLTWEQGFALRERLLRCYENQGYPFAQIRFDSLRLEDGEIQTLLTAEKGLLYRIDSIQVFGNPRIRKSFLHRYLDIPPASAYDARRLGQVDTRIRELSFLSATQPSDLSLLSTGATLNLYLKNRKNSQFNFLVGAQSPATGTGGLQLTGDVNLDLKNMFGAGEQILFKWQQLQFRSPRLQLGYNQPYLFSSPFGADLFFDLFRKDSSFLQWNARVGVRYDQGPTHQARFFISWQSNRLLPGGVDTAAVAATRQLPANIDQNTSTLGVHYQWNGTDYRPNPRRGGEGLVQIGAGIKSIFKNNEILALKSGSTDLGTLYDSLRLRTYQWRVQLQGAAYLPVRRSGVFKLAFSGGLFFSPEIFRNDLFQIGGYRTLRGFDEESIFSTRYGILTAEYRLLLGTNAHLAFFSEGALSQYRYQSVLVDQRFLSAGIGLMIETGAGLLNFSYAAGTQQDVPFNIRQASKLHFGYVNYF